MNVPPPVFVSTVWLQLDLVELKSLSGNRGTLAARALQLDLVELKYCESGRYLQTSSRFNWTLWN